ncbi:TPA: hypothetical protein ACUNF5_006726 [Burkholderia orbicola]|uniref:DUF3085 domain-containing protein n=1 Tax=Burkholderia cenocepacia TaxID=95486 RepID=A0AAW4TUT8_9BURK|nr:MULTISPECIES: hypothetical protein [Burkholderia cepacia complex]MCA8383572.1 hypothetical protein [Burkholderia cenocepacia]MDN7533987.1 hypothetical protein [Burkholderia orbicola]
MNQLVLKMPNLHRVIDRAHADLIARGAAIAAECGLAPCGPAGWSNGLRDADRIALVVYRPRHGGGERYGVTRFFDGQYASADCVLPEHATRALLAATRAEFERICAADATRRADIRLDACVEDPDGASIELLASDVDVQRRDARLEAQQLALF